MPSLPKVSPQAPRSPLGNRPTLRQRGYIAVDGVPVPPGAIDYRWLGPGRVQWIFPNGGGDDSHGGGQMTPPPRSQPAPRGPLTLRQRGIVAVDGVPVPDGAIDYRWLGRGRIQWIFPNGGNGGDRQPSGEMPSGERQKITERLWRIGGSIHERIPGPQGERFQALFGRPDGVPGGSMGTLSEEGQRDLVKVYCDQGFSGYQGQRLVNALAFLSRRQNDLTRECLDGVVRPALARVPMGQNRLVDGLRVQMNRPALPQPPKRKAQPEEKGESPAPEEDSPAPKQPSGGSHIDYARLKPAEKAAIDTCVRCHQNRGGVGADFKTAQGILDHFGERSWEKIETMFNRPGADFRPGDRDLVKALHDRARGTEQPGRQIASTEARRCSLMDQSLEARYLGVLPDGPAGSVLEGLRKVAVPYTTAQMPRARQSNPPDAAYTVPLADSAMIPRFSMGYPDRAGFEFPWQHPGGMLESSGTFKFFVPPSSGPMADIFKAGRNTRVKLDGRWESLYGQSTNLYGQVTAWTFRPGTVFGEVFTTNAPDGTTYPTEIRVREVGADGKWRYRVYRPFTSAADLAATVRKEFPDWGKDESLSRFVRVLEDENQATLKRPSQYLSPLAMRLNSQAATALQSEAPVQVLPALPAEYVRKLLDRPFREVTGPWNTKGGKSAWAPQSEADFGLFPRQAKLAPFLPSTTEGCTKCHDSTLVHLDRLNPAPGVVPGANGSVRDWYGHDMGSLPQPVAGSNNSAGIRSWHPWDGSSLTSGNGAERQARFNPTLWRCGLLNVTNEVR